MMTIALALALALRGGPVTPAPILPPIATGRVYTSPQLHQGTVKDLGAGGEAVKKIVRNMSTSASRTFWESAERGASEIEEWPAWRRAGINVAPLREQPREVPKPGRPQSTR
jgi:hypothetical protein